MVWIAGADGCKKGWFRVSRETSTGAVRFHVLERASDMLDVAPQPAILGVDIPIGLTDAGRRACDCCARERLGWPRRNSVFPAPIRPALHATTRDGASRITYERDGRKVGAQAWALYPKIREVDDLLQMRAEAGARICEVHPELSFCAWSGGAPMAAGKKTRAGKAQRRDLAEGWLGAGVLDAARGDLLKREVADDDILDAIAVLWTAARIARDAAERVPKDPPLDSTGLRMEIVF